MRWVFAFIIALHGLIHLMGPAKAFGYADLTQLTQPISRGMGLVWLLAAVLTLVATVALFVWPRGWWMSGAAALVVSQAVIFTSWTDAKAGAIANLILLAGVAYGFFTQGPTSFRAQYERDVRAGVARFAEAPVLTEADLVPTPSPPPAHAAPNPPTATPSKPADTRPTTPDPSGNTGSCTNASTTRGTQVLRHPPPGRSSPPSNFSCNRSLWKPTSFPGN